jgi:hypothetical protein
MTREEQKKFEKELEMKKAPKEYHSNNYPVTIKYCPGYEGYVPENLGHEVCMYCENINYYH